MYMQLLIIIQYECANKYETNSWLTLTNNQNTIILYKFLQVVQANRRFLILSNNIIVQYVLHSP